MTLVICNTIRTRGTLPSHHARGRLSSKESIIGAGRAPENGAGSRELNEAMIDDQ